jgi:hypothetical protein
MYTSNACIQVVRREARFEASPAVNKKNTIKTRSACFMAGWLFVKRLKEQSDDRPEQCPQVHVVESRVHRDDRHFRVVAIVAGDGVVIFHCVEAM